MKFPLETKYEETVIKTEIIKDRKELSKFLKEHFLDLYYSPFREQIIHLDYPLFDMKFPRHKYEKLFSVILYPKEEEDEYKQKECSEFISNNDDLCRKFLYQIIIDEINKSTNKNE